MAGKTKARAKPNGKPGKIEVSGKAFAFTSGTESELEAYTRAGAYLRQLHDTAIKRVAPAPGSQRRWPRTYEVGGSVVGTDGIVLTPAPAKMQGKGH